MLAPPLTGRAAARRPGPSSQTLRPVHAPRPARGVPARPPPRAGAEDAGAGAEAHADEGDVVPAAPAPPPNSPTPSALSAATSSAITTPTPDAAWLLTFLPFSRLSTDAANYVVSVAEPATIPAGEVIVSPGDQPGLTVIRAGNATVTSPNAARPYTVGPGAAFGMRSILSGQPLYLGATAGRGGSAAAAASLALASLEDAAAAGDGRPPVAALLADATGEATLEVSGTVTSPFEAGGPGAPAAAAGPAAPAPATTPPPTLVWRFPASILDQLASRFPGAERELLAGAAERAEAEAAAAASARAELEDDRARAAALQPYLVTSPKRGVIGASKYADRLRRAVVGASRSPTRAPVLIFGEPGLNKDNIAALIHFGSPDFARPLIAVDCDRLDSEGAVLFGRGNRRGLLAWLGDGTLLLNNVHLTPPGLRGALRALVTTGAYTPAPSPRRAAGAGGLAPAPILDSPARIMITAEKRVADFEALMTVIKVPPLRVRPADVGPLARFFLADLSRRAGLPPTDLTSSALRQLEAYTFPDNIAELQAAVERAAAQSATAPGVSAAAAAAAAATASREGLAPVGGRPGGGPAAKAARASATKRLALSLPSPLAAAAGKLSEAVSSAAESSAVARKLMRGGSKGSAARGGGAPPAGGPPLALASLADVDLDAQPLPPAPGAASGAAIPAVALISAESLWFAAEGRDRLRLNLLATLPWLRPFLRGEFWVETLNFKIIAPIYAAYVAYLFLGPQDRAHSFGLNLFWCWWWPGIFLVYPALGRVWCTVCPFMIYGELVQRARTAAGAKLRRWPKESIEAWGPWFLYALFFGILVWERVWRLDDHAALSSWLLLLITAGAMVCSFFFEKRLWCRYLCPIGGMNGMFAKLAATELRARQGVCAAECDTYHCYKGGPAEAPEGLATDGCPLGSHPAQLKDNRHCVLCMDCLKACPHRSVEFRLRIPGADLVAAHEATHAELAMLFMLLGAVGVHHLPAVAGQFGFLGDGAWMGAPPSFLSLHALAASALMLAPWALVYGLDTAGRALLAAQRGSTGAPAVSYSVSPALARAAATAATAGQPAPFVRLAYGYLPLTWAATLAHYEESALREAGTVGRVLVEGLPGPLGASWAPSVPVFVADPAVVAFVQGVTLLLGLGLGLGLTRKIGGRPWRDIGLQCAGMVGVTAELWWLIVR